MERDEHALWLDLCEHVAAGAEQPAGYRMYFEVSTGSVVQLVPSKKKGGRS